MMYEDILNSRFIGPAAVISYKDGRIGLVEVNDKYIPELWINASKEDFAKGYPTAYFDEDKLQMFTDAVRRCAETGKEQTLETWRLVLSDCCGFDKVCIKSKLVLIEKKGDEAFVYEAVRNITNEKKTQENLEDIEYRYKSASEQINIYNWEYTIATKEMRPCYRCMRDLGLPAVVENYPEPAIEAGIFPPDYADMYRDMMRRIDAGETGIQADIPLTVGRVPFRIKYTTTFDEAGKPVKAFGSATLISETELGKIRLDNKIIATLADEYRCIYLVDLREDTVKTVKQDDTVDLREGADCRELFDYFGVKIFGTPDENEMRPDTLDLMRTDLFRDSDKREFVYKDDESEKWIRLEFQVIDRGQDCVDRLLVMVSVIDDLMAQKMDADRLIALQKKELEDRQQMLLSAVEEAGRANRAKTEFFSNLSHDIRTPMNAIVGFSRLAIEDIGNTELVKDYLSKIDSAGEHLLKLINDILDMSRIESGKMELTQSPACLKTLALECADMVKVKMDENKLNFIVNVEEMGDDTVECDKLRFCQIVLNLLSNAYKFTPEGGSVTLCGKLLSRGDKLTYEIRVKDTGIGMSHEFMEHIWEAYSREKNDIVNETQGTGLGMVIVRNLVNMMHGTIDLSSKPGEGSEFVIVLPFEPARSSETETEKDRIENEALNKDYSGVGVLVVDDVALNLKLAEGLLKKYGFNVKTSSSGIDALEQLKAAAPGEISVILMDVKMPVMDGLETTRRIRALDDPAIAKLPVIAMTANAFDSDVQEALGAGMNAHVPKPFRKEELLTAIYNNLR